MKSLLPKSLSTARADNNASHDATPYHSDDAWQRHQEREAMWRAHQRHDAYWHRTYTYGADQPHDYPGN